MTISSSSMIPFLENVYATQFEGLKTTYQPQFDKISTTLSALSKLTSTVDGFRTANNAIIDTVFSNRLLKSSDEDVATVTSTTSANALGDYDLTVNALAQNQRNNSQEMLASATLSAGILEITDTPTGEKLSVTVTAGDTLQSLADQINEASTLDGGSDNPIGATVISYLDSSGVAQQRIQVFNENTGSANAFTTTNTVAEITDITTIDDTAANAQVTIGGTVPIIAYSATNTFTDILEGVNVSLSDKAKVNDTVTIKASTDTEGVKTFINDLITSHNSLIDSFNDPTIAAAKDGVRGPLTANSTVSSLKFEIKDFIAATYNGKTLSDFGITIGTDSKLEIDDSILDGIISTDINSLKDFFTTDTTGFVAVVESALDGYLDSDDGLFTGLQETLTNKQDQIQATFTKKVDRLTAEREKVIAQVTNTEQLMQNLSAQMSMFSQLGMF